MTVDKLKISVPMLLTPISSEPVFARHDIRASKRSQAHCSRRHVEGTQRPDDGSRCGSA